MATSRDRLVGLSILLTTCMGGFATGCSSDAPESIAFADDAPSISAPSTAEFTDDERQLISFHAEWLCELQRRTFSSLDESEAALITALEDAALNQRAYDRFLSDVLSTQAARDAVFYQHQQDCRAK